MILSGYQSFTMTAFFLKTRVRIGRTVSWLKTDRAAALFTWSVWLGLSVVALGVVWRYAPETLSCDDWTMTVPVLTGDRSITDNMWDQVNEHRLPLVRLVILSLAKWTGGWFRIENFLNAVILSFVAAGLILVARRIRGRVSWCDAFFPVALLNLAHVDAFAFRLTFNHVLAASLSSVVLSLIAIRSRGPTPSAIVMAGVVLLSLPLCGANGLPVVLAGSLWLAWAGVVVLRTQPLADRVGLACVPVALAAVLLVALYFVGYRAPPHTTATPSIDRFIDCSLQCLSLSLAPFHLSWWPWSRWLMPALAFGAGAILVTAWVRRPDERWRSFGLLVFMGAMLTTAVGIGWGRAMMHEFAGTPPRYATVTVPVLLTVYLTAVIYGSRYVKQAMQASLFVLLCVMFPFQLSRGLGLARTYSDVSKGLLKEMRDGAPPEYLSQRFAGCLYPCQLSPHVHYCLVRLRQAGIAPYHLLRDLPPCSTESLPLRPVCIHQMDWDGAAGESRGSDPYLVFDVDPCGPVRAVRIRFVIQTPGSPAAHLRFLWRHGSDGFSPTKRNALFVVASEPIEQTLLVWINDRVDQIRVDVESCPCRVEIRQLELLR